MRILVIEDNDTHIESAKRTLSDHQVTYAQTFGEATRALEVDWKNPSAPPSFDAVLTDMFLPMSCDYDSMTYGWYQEGALVPYGLILAMKAAQRGVKYVAMVTDVNHHHGALSAALDLIDCGFTGQPFTVNGSRVSFLHVKLRFEMEDLTCNRCSGTGFEKQEDSFFEPPSCRHCQGLKYACGKDWGKVLSRLMNS